MDIKKCSTIELVNLLNDGLASGLSGAKICKENNLARSSVLTRLKREGYVHDKETNSYIKEGEEKAETKEKKKKVTKKKAEPVKKEVKKTTKKTTKKSTNEQKPVKVKAIEEVVVEEEYYGEEDTENNTNSLEEVEKKISKLRETLHGGKSKEKAKKEVSVKKVEVPVVVEEKIEVATAIQEDNTDELMELIKSLSTRIDKLENGKVETSVVSIQNTKETTTRSIRLYKEVNDKLNNYIKTNKEKKVIDVLSLAILEYINKK